MDKESIAGFLDCRPIPSLFVDSMCTCLEMLFLSWTKITPSRAETDADKTKQTVGAAGGPVFAHSRANRLYRDAAYDHVCKFPDGDHK